MQRGLGTGVPLTRPSNQMQIDPTFYEANQPAPALQSPSSRAPVLSVSIAFCPAVIPAFTPLLWLPSLLVTIPLPLVLSPSHLRETVYFP